MLTKKVYRIDRTNLDSRFAWKVVNPCEISFRMESAWDGGSVFRRPAEGSKWSEVPTQVYNSIQIYTIYSINIFLLITFLINNERRLKLFEGHSEHRDLDNIVKVKVVGAAFVNLHCLLHFLLDLSLGSSSFPHLLIFISCKCTMSIYFIFF